MATKNLKRIGALALCAAMMIGGSTTVFAAAGEATANGDGGSATGDAVVYSYDITDVIVPTTITAAFNPQGLNVAKHTGETAVTDEIVSLNYGIVNKSYRDKVVGVSLKATLSAADKTAGVKFASSKDEIDTAETDKSEDLLIYLALAADTAGSISTAGSSGAALDKDTAATAVGDVTITADTTKNVVLGESDTLVGFTLDAATFTQTDLVLGTDASTSGKFEISALGANGATSFTLTGAMNSKADWTKVAGPITVSATYTIQDATGDETSVVGQMVKMGPQVSCTAAGVITITNLTATQNFSSLSFTESGTTTAATKDFTYDKTNWTSDAGGTLNVTMPSSWVTYYAGKTVTVTVTLSDDSTITCSVTFPAASGE